MTPTAKQFLASKGRLQSEGEEGIRDLIADMFEEFGLLQWNAAIESVPNMARMIKYNYDGTTQRDLAVLQDSFGTITIDGASILKLKK